MVSRVGEQGRPEFATNDPSSEETVAEAVNDMLSFTSPYDASGR